MKKLFSTLIGFSCLASLQGCMTQADPPAAAAKPAEPRVFFIGMPGQEAAALAKTADAAPFIQLFTEPNYEGASLKVPGNLEFNVFTHTPKGNLNDKFSSVKVFHGAVAYLHVAHSFTGGYAAITQDVPHLANLGMDNIASSVSWYTPDRTPTTINGCQERYPGEPCVELFSAINYQGPFLYGYEADLNNLEYIRIGSSWNDVISSIRVFNGAWVRVCAAHSWTGGCLDVTENIPDLRLHGFNDVISSFAFQPVTQDQF